MICDVFACHAGLPRIGLWTRCRSLYHRRMAAERGMRLLLAVTVAGRAEGALYSSRRRRKPSSPGATVGWCLSRGGGSAGCSGQVQDAQLKMHNCPLITLVHTVLKVRRAIVLQPRPNDVSPLCPSHRYLDQQSPPASAFNTPQQGSSTAASGGGASGPPSAAVSLHYHPLLPPNPAAAPQGVDAALAAAGSSRATEGWRRRRWESRRFPLGRA